MLLQIVYEYKEQMAHTSPAVVCTLAQADLITNVSPRTRDSVLRTYCDPFLFYMFYM
jgi:hypothetical protein